MKIAQRLRTLLAPRSAPTARRFRPRLETLTDRIAPAVTAAVNGGVLTVQATGAAADDEMTVLPLDFPGRFRVTGTGGTVVNGTANGTLDALGVNSIRFDLGDGDDLVTMDNILLPGGITFRGGNGANFFALRTSRIGGSVSVTHQNNDADTDVTGILSTTVNGNVIVSNGTGAASGTFLGASIQGNLSYTTPGSGTDTVLATGLNVGGNITLALGDGANSFTGETLPVEAGGRFRYTGGAGVDVVALRSDTTFGASATISLGEGANNIGFSGDMGLFVGSRLRVTAGAGNDVISLVPTGARVTKAASFSLGDGNNIFLTNDFRMGSLSLITGGGNDTATLDDLIVVGAANLNLGPGTNTVELASTGASTAASSVGGAFTLSSGVGADTIRVGVNFPFHVVGAARFTTGTAAGVNGNDLVFISRSLFASGLAIVTGSGNDVVQLALLGSIGVAGRLGVNGGAGNDDVSVGTFNDAARAVRVTAVPSFVGGGGDADILRLFGQGNLLGPPGVNVLPTGPALTAAGWEGIA